MARISPAQTGAHHAQNEAYAHVGHDGESMLVTLPAGGHGRCCGMEIPDQG